MIELLVVEDDELIRGGLVTGLTLDGYSVRDASTLAQARQRFGEVTPGLVLLDVGLPDGSGLEFLAELRARGEHVPVLVLTARGTEEDRVVGFEHGCDDYVVKPFSLRELRHRISALLRRAPSVATSPSTTVQIGDAVVDLSAHRVTGPRGEAPLAPKELEMLQLLLDRPGEVISREEFLREVWGYERAPVTRTIDMHIRRLREKLEPDPKEPRHLVTVHGAGYRLDPA